MGILRTSKSDKGFSIQLSEITLRHDALETHESHNTFTYSLWNIKNAPLDQLVKSFTLKNISNVFGFICDSTTFGKTFKSTPKNHVLYF